MVDQFQEQQDVVGQFPFLKAYMHSVLGFAADNKISREEIVQSLEFAIVTVTNQIPWLAHRVINDGSKPGSTGVFKTAPWPPGASPNKILRIKVCDKEMPSFDTILSSGVPMSMIHEKDIAPCASLPARYEESDLQPAPVVILQANFVVGGLILTCSIQHNILDGGGMFQFYNLIATAMRGETLPAAAIEQGNRDRSTVIPLMRPGEPLKDHSYMRRSTTLTPPALKTEGYLWSYFRLHRGAEVKLKQLASVGEGYDKTIPFISTNDALSAFYWQRIGSVRLRQGQSVETVSKFGRSINVRGTMGVPDEYLGLMVYHCATHLTFGELDSLPLATVACRLRRDLIAAMTPLAVRSYATFLASIPDKSSISYGGPYNPVVDIASSNVSLNSFMVPFGLLGTPKFLRKPNAGPIPSCLHFFPAENGHVVIAVCLPLHELNALKSDTVWSEYADFIG